MAHPMNYAIEHAMSTALDNAVFADLAGAGEPLPNLNQPKDAVLAHMLKEADAKPLAVSLQQQIVTARAQLKNLRASEDRKAQLRLLAELQMRLNMEIEAFRKYA